MNPTTYFSKHLIPSENIKISKFKFDNSYVYKYINNDHG